MRRALVLGAGRSGLAAETLLGMQGVEVVVLDGEAAFPSGDRNARPSAVSLALGCAPSWGTGGSGDRNARPSAVSLALGCAPAEGAEVGAATFLSPRETGFDFAVVSPGIPLTHPWIVEAKRLGIPLKSELQLGCEELKRRGWKLLAVTGSKGKSSVVKVVADAINLAGMKAVACGNYGVPVCEVVEGSGDRNVAAPSWGTGGSGDRNVAAPSWEAGDSGDRNVAAPRWTAEAGAQPSASETAEGRAFLSPLKRWAVVEISSFMMETTTLPQDTFEAAAILNLQEDHLDRHGSVEVYHGLKRRLLDFAKRRLDCGDRNVAAPAGGTCGSGDRNVAAPAGVAAEVGAATFLSPLLWKGSYFDNEILAGNAAMSVELMRVAGLDDATIAKAFGRFEPLPHRMNLVAEIGGVRYVDDSKATSLSALAAGVKMASSRTNAESRGQETEDRRQPKRILLIAGGLPKGDDPKSVLSTLTERVKKVYLIGQCAEVFQMAWKGAVDCEICGTLDRAVERAACEAGKGETVLLSPGTASFDQFKSFGERGEVFARLVKEKEKQK